ncbi:MAG: lactate utilization protein [Clostridia bacterium]
MQIDTVVTNLNKRRYLAKYFRTTAAAKAEILEIIGTQSVGIGGSKSINDTHLYDDLIARGNRVFCHTFASLASEKQTARRDAMDADIYLCSANAITQNGLIVNIDGTGNRVAATIFGPKTVIMLVGKNKLVSSVEAGIARTKRDNCPRNASRLGVDTPCSATGRCADCSGTGRMCNVTVIYEYPTRNVDRFYVFLVDEELGW